MGKNNSLLLFFEFLERKNRVELTFIQNLKCRQSAYLDGFISLGNFAYFIHFILLFIHFIHLFYSFIHPDPWMIMVSHGIQTFCLSQQCSLKACTYPTLERLISLFFPTCHRLDPQFTCYVATFLQFSTWKIQLKYV